MDIPVFSGGWSYTQKEMTELFKHIKYTPAFSILEFGSGDSTIKLYTHFKKYVENLTFYTYESNPDFRLSNDNINLMMYDEQKIQTLELPPIQFDLILIDGPNGDKRSLWYSKLRNNVKEGTILLVDDFNHYPSFSTELDKNFKYDVLSFHDEPFVPYGEHSWKIVRILKTKW